MKFFDQFVNRPPADEEFNSGEEIVEKAGYIPAEIQIMEMINAGERLGEARRERYDYGEGDEDDGMMDPTRIPGVDMADLSQMKLGVEARLEDQKKEMEKKKDIDIKGDGKEEKEEKKDGSN